VIELDPLSLHDALPILADLRRCDPRVRPAVSRSLWKGDGHEQRRVVMEADFPVALVNGAADPVLRLGYLESLDIPALWQKNHVIDRKSTRLNSSHVKIS